MRKLTDATAAIDGAFRKRLLIPNYAAGKNALVIQTQGRLSRALRRHIAFELGSKIPVRGTNHHIGIVYEYKHLGTFASSNSEATPSAYWVSPTCM